MSFFEVLVILLVALIVVGPKQLPVVAKKVGYWYQAARHLLRRFEQDIDTQMKDERLKENTLKADEAKKAK